MDDRKALIQKIKTQNGMLQRQSKIINMMCEYLADNDFCFEKGKCKRSDKSCEQCIREHFERKVK